MSQAIWLNYSLYKTKADMSRITASRRRKSSSLYYSQTENGTGFALRLRRGMSGGIVVGVSSTFLAIVPPLRGDTNSRRHIKHGDNIT